MKVAFFFTYGYSLKSWENSGILQRELKILKELSKKYKYEFTLITYGDNSDLKLLNKSEAFEVIPIYSLLKESKYKYINLMKSFMIPFKIKKIIDTHDIIHQHQLQGAWVSILTKLINNIPLLVRTGYDVFTFAKYESKSKFKIKLFKLLTKYSLKFCDTYTVTSKSDFSIIKTEFSKYINKVKIRPNYVDILNTKDVLQRPRNKILSVGRLVDQKNFEKLIIEFTNSKDDIIIDIIGTGELENQILKKANTLNVKVNLLGNLSNNELMKLYQNYKFYISTSKFEGNPKSILEAMSAGCIVIASNIKNHSEIIENNKSGVLFDLNNPSLIKLINNLNENESLCRELSNNATSYIYNNNSIDILSKNIDKDYIDLINTA